jgi:hypothetical protein
MSAGMWMYDRAHGEATIMEHEMEWTAYFKLHESDRASIAHKSSSGYKSYALQQEATYA